MSAAGLQTVKVILTPIEARLEDARVAILEVVGSEWLGGERRYIVSCYVEWNGYRSQTFRLDVRDGRELDRKLRTELAKMKLALMTGYEHIFAKTG
jgi:hypothetical protein